MTELPIDGVWEADPEIKKLCGIWECPADTFCGNPADYDIERNFHENDHEEFYYNLSRFDDFFHSLFVTYLFLNVTGWSGTTYYVISKDLLSVLEGNDYLCDCILFC